MDVSDLENLIICDNCGCVFDMFKSADSYKENKAVLKITICPACKHDYEIPRIIIN